MSDNTIEALIRRLNAIEEEVRVLKKKADPSPNLPASDSTGEFNPCSYGGEQELIAEGLGKVAEGSKAVIKEGIFAVTTTTGIFGWNGGTQGWHTVARHESVDKLPDDDIQPILEPFTNPRRIKVLKALFNKKLTGSELSQQTSLVGGQLYHHLGILEEAKLIAKERETYTLTLKGAKVLLMLVTLASDVWVQTVAEK